MKQGGLRFTLFHRHASMQTVDYSVPALSRSPRLLYNRGICHTKWEITSSMSEKNFQSDENPPESVDVLDRLAAFARELDFEEEQEEDFWAVFSMMLPSGERFSLNLCFRSRHHYNTEMMKFQTAKNLHVVLRDANDESVVIKRDLLVYVLPQGIKEES